MRIYTYNKTMPRAANLLINNTLRALSSALLLPRNTPAIALNFEIHVISLRLYIYMYICIYVYYVYTDSEIAAAVMARHAFRARINALAIRRFGDFNFEPAAAAAAGQRI